MGPNKIISGMFVQMADALASAISRNERVVVENVYVPLVIDW
jgi:hypothetical protein